jgi:hypothetical protein
VPRLIPADLSRFRTTLYAGARFDSGAVRRLIEEVESAWADLARQRVEIATKGGRRAREEARGRGGVQSRLLQDGPFT